MQSEVGYFWLSCVKIRWGSLSPVLLLMALLLSFIVYFYLGAMVGLFFTIDLSQYPFDWLYSRNRSLWLFMLFALPYHILYSKPVVGAGT
ncbi:hypothetical protein BGX38DRAFT_1187003 [Terfezia claveryi]|nr:hypothetical protein BGX38DRAFT_1187003 [Terfezia claveryi]